MAKTWNNNVFVLDAANQGTNSNIRVFSITVDASGAAWAVVLTNKDGSVNFSAKNSETNQTFAHFIFPTGMQFQGLSLTTFTNCTRVILTTEAIYNLT